MNKVVRIRFGNKLPLVGLLHKVLISLLVSEVNGIFFRLELYPVALHVIARRLPSHERVLPSVALGQRIPVHQPVM